MNGNITAMMFKFHEISVFLKKCNLNQSNLLGWLNSLRYQTYSITFVRQVFFLFYRTLFKMRIFLVFVVALLLIANVIGVEGITAKEAMENELGKLKLKRAELG